MQLLFLVSDKVDGFLDFGITVTYSVFQLLGHSLVLDALLKMAEMGPARSAGMSLTRCGSGLQLTCESFLFLVSSRL